MWSHKDIGDLRIEALSEDENNSLRRLLTIWKSRLSANQKRSLYFEGEQGFKDLGIALPPQLKRAKTCLGWPLQAVRKAAIRSQFQGLRLPGVDDPFELNEVLERNRFSLEFSQANMGAGKHGVSFISVARGETSTGEPPVQIQAHSAQRAAASWDSRRRAINEAITLGSFDENGDPDDLTLWLPENIIYCARDGNKWSVTRRATPTRRVQVVPVSYDPQLEKPLGRSRITDPVMTITDMAVRAYVRMEGNAELYSFPQLAAEGVKEDAFSNVSQADRFQIAMDRIIALSTNDEGDSPTLKQFSQASMQPHSDMLRTVAMAFCGETGIPPASLGVVADSNPSSEAAIRAGEHDLLIDVTNQNKHVLNHAASDIARLAIMVRDDLPEPPTEAWKLSARFADPEFRSSSANADAYVKLAGANPDIADSPSILGLMFDPDEVSDIQAHLRRKQGSGLLERVLSSRKDADSDGEQGDAEAVDGGTEPDNRPSEQGLEGTVRDSAV